MKLVLYMVMSMDGVVAFDEQRDIREYSSREDHLFFSKGAAACDAVIMGRFSYNRELACKRKYLLSRSAKRSELDLNTVLLSGDVREIYDRIEGDGNRRVALLGGPRTNSAFLEAGLVDEIFLTVEPVMLGEGVHFTVGELRSRWVLEQSIRLNEQGTVVQHYVQKLETFQSENRWEKILHVQTFADILEKLTLVERDRRFCKHDLTHLLDTARLMYIWNLEEGCALSKDLIYATALLHDIGRLKQYMDGTDHEEAALPIADNILKTCKYTQAERETILFAIAAHRREPGDGGDQEKTLAHLLYRADKAGRACFACSANGECNWPEEKKNTILLY